VALILSATVAEAASRSATTTGRRAASSGERAADAPPPPVTMATLPATFTGYLPDAEAFAELRAGVGGVGVQNTRHPEASRPAEVLLQIVDHDRLAGSMPSRVQAA
jgi:hypothetical protein